jgi:uncharacterized coiled-coil DUF342 family protein
MPRPRRLAWHESLRVFNSRLIPGGHDYDKLKDTEAILNQQITQLLKGAETSTEKIRGLEASISEKDNVISKLQ